VAFASIGLYLEIFGRATLSIGAVTLPKGDSAQWLIERANQWLYAAKRHGHNRVMCDADPEITAESAATQVV
jgi:diguanylate cyclase